MSGGVATYYVSPAYEVTAPSGLPIVTKYIYLNGQRHPRGSRMERGSAVTYLHTDHLGSTVAESSGTTVTTNQSYCAYGRKRTTSGGNTNCSSSNSLATDHTFTGQKYDSSGLQFFNARYYDPPGAHWARDLVMVVDRRKTMQAKNRFLREMPSDLLLLAALFNSSAVFYNLFVKPEYLLAGGWLVSSVLFFLRSQQLSPIRNQLRRSIFWVVGIGVLISIWLFIMD